MKDKEMIKRIGNYCKNFRTDRLELSLTEFCELNNLNIKNVNAFEFGRANNIQYLYQYYRMCDDGQRRTFALNVFKQM